MTWRIGLQGTDVEIPVDVAVAWRSNLEILPNNYRQVIDVIVEGDQFRSADQPDFQCDPVLTRQAPVMLEARLDGLPSAGPRCRSSPIRAHGEPQTEQDCSRATACVPPHRSC